MEGQLNSALRYLSEVDSGGVLPLTDDVARQPREKHPDAQRAKLGSLLFGPVEDIPDSVYQEINGELVRLGGRSDDVGEVCKISATS